MQKINILDKSIFNRIAAGEVVERPSSVVKELVENSIDANATNILVEILDGGIKKIRVSDNGCGIAKEDFKNAFLPHATSKIKTIDDLNKIGTLGFRGEALSSIASISKINATSKTKENDIGSKIMIDAGEIVSLEDAGCVDGTSICVEDLFYCVPARLKFLRKPKTEETEITNLIARLIMANPTVSIKYVANNKTIFHSNGTNLLDAIYTIYGENTINNLIEVDYKYNELISVYGYISKPNYTKPNRTYQTIIINGRYVINKTISTAIYNAYEPFMMKNSFPFFVLHVSIPLDKIDVNVHPNKLDVKFENNNLIYGAFYNPINNELLNQSTNIREYNVEESKDDIIKDEILDLTKLSKIDDNLGYEFTKEKTNDEVHIANIEESTDINNIKNELNNIKQNYNLNTLNNKYPNDILTNSFEVHNNKNNIETIKINSESKNEIQNSLFNNEIQHTDLTTLKIIGTCFNTYIIVQDEANIYFIDQHAGHERFLYDKFNESLNNKTFAIQSLIVPYILNTNHLESQFINDNLSVFKNLGFEIEEFGINSFKVSTVPVLLKDISLSNFFNEVLNDLSGNININKNIILKEYLQKKACRSAVKANDILSISEIKILLNMLNNEKQILLCPHGRPIIIKISQKEIEKWFKRIV